jgi:hypothetical protein
VLAYFFSWSKGTGRVSRTVTLALSVGFMVYSEGGFGSGVARIRQWDNEAPAFPQELADCGQLQSIRESNCVLCPSQMAILSRPKASRLLISVIGTDE